MADKKTARQAATEIEVEQNFPILNKYNRTAAGAVEKMGPGVGKEMARGAALAGMVPAGLLQIGQSAVTGRKGRSQEEMDELTREVGRAQRAEKQGADKNQKSGMELEIENAKKDRQLKKEYEAYEKYDKNRLKDQGSFKKGGKVSSASARADGIAQRGKTRGKMV
jgi:hypothetical protein